MAVKRGFYNKPLRRQAILEIRRKIVEGESYEEIMRDLHLPERTFFSYLKHVFEHDREVMSVRIPREEVMDQITILKERFTQIYKQCQEMATNSEVDDIARVRAMQLARELALSIVKIHRETTAILARCKELPFNIRELEQLQQSQSKQQQGQSLSYNDNLDDEEDEEEDDVEDEEEGGGDK